MATRATASPSILVVGGSPQQRAWTVRVIGELYANTTSSACLADAPPLGEHDLVIASYEDLHGRDRRALLDAAQRAPGDRPGILMTSRATRDWEPLFEALEEHALTNLLCLDHDASEVELRVTVRKLLGADIFGIDPYVPDASDARTVRIRSSHDVARAVDAATEFATARKIHPRLVENAATAVDEMITNALYNAPVDAEGAPRFAHLPRTEPIELEPDEEVVLELRYNGALLGVAVSDAFGTLTKAQALDYLARCLRRQKQEPHVGKGGAGIGLFITFGALNHLALDICRGERTEVIGLIDVRGTYRDFVERGKSFNIFFCPCGGR